MHPTFSADELAATRALVESLGDRETVQALGVFHVAFDRRALPEVIGVTSEEADYLVGQLENERWVVSDGYICRLHPCVSPALGSALGRARWVELSERWLSALLSAVERRRAGSIALARDEVAARLAHIEAGVNAASLLIGEALGDVAWLRSYREATRLTTDRARAAELVKLRGELHAQHGQAAQAVEALREARARFVALGDELEAEECSALLEELGGA